MRKNKPFLSLIGMLIFVLLLSACQPVPAPAAVPTSMPATAVPIVAPSLVPTLPAPTMAATAVMPVTGPDATASPASQNDNSNGNGNDNSNGNSNSNGSGSDDTPMPGVGALVNSAKDATLGNILVDSKGMVLYLFTKDTPGVSNCKGGCLTAWPRLLSSGKPVAGSGVDDSKLGLLKLADGTTQVTYNQLPLYYYAKDTKPGDTTGQGVGGVWFIVNP